MMFITLEGPDGSGKSSQMNPLAEYLREQGHDVLETREPGGTEIGDQVRQVIMDLKNKSMFPSSEILLSHSSPAPSVRRVEYRWCSMPIWLPGSRGELARDPCRLPVISQNKLHF